MQPVLLASRECGRDWPMSPLSQTDGGVSHKNLKGLARWNQTNRNTKRGKRIVLKEFRRRTKECLFVLYKIKSWFLSFLVFNNNNKKGAKKFSRFFKFFDWATAICFCFYVETGEEIIFQTYFHGGRAQSRANPHRHATNPNVYSIYCTMTHNFSAAGAKRRVCNGYSNSFQVFPS